MATKRRTAGLAAIAVVAMLALSMAFTRQGLLEVSAACRRRDPAGPGEPPCPQGNFKHTGFQETCKLNERYYELCAPRRLGMQPHILDERTVLPEHKELFDRLVKDMRTSSPAYAAMQLEASQGLTKAERERLSYLTKTIVVYSGTEVPDLQNAEVDAVMRAVPVGFEPRDLNGLNVGAGGRVLNPYMSDADANRGSWEHGYGEFMKNSLLSWANDLPFKEESLDFVAAVHVLEHLSDPIETIEYWATLVRDGGGIGVVVPNFRFSWDSRNDQSDWGHRWNPTPKAVCELYRRHWCHFLDLEELKSYPEYELSFDFVLRKRGEFKKFHDRVIPRQPTGFALQQSGEFLHLDDYDTASSK